MLFHAVGEVTLGLVFGRLLPLSVVHLVPASVGAHLSEQIRMLLSHSL